MRTFKIAPGVIAIALLTSCSAVDKVTSFVSALAENMTPVLSEPSAPDELSAIEDSPFSLQLQVTDDDLQYGDKLSFSPSSPGWLYLTLDEGGRHAENEDVGAHEVQVRSLTCRSVR